MLGLAEKLFTGGDVPKALLSPDGTHIVWEGQGHQIVVADVDSGRINRILRGHRDSVSAIAFSPDGTRLLTASYDNSVRVWDIAPLPRD